MFDVVISLGNGAQNILEEIKKNTDDPFLFSVSPKEPATFVLLHKKTPEEYETDFPYFPFLDDIEMELGTRDEVRFLLILCGGSLTANIVGPLIEQIKNHHFDPKKVSVLFVQPDETLLNQKKKMMSKTQFAILQEWARSGAIDKFWVVSNRSIEQLYDSFPITKYHQEINLFIAKLLISLREFHHISSAFEQINDLPIGARIGTFSVCLFNKNKIETKNCFPLANTTDVCYYLAFPTKELENDKNILSMIKSLNEKNERVSYKIFATDFEKRYGYCVKLTSVIQAATTQI